MISIRNISKRFGPQVVLDGVNIEIKDGETTAVVGPSGVGKSVLLKLIMGIMEPDGGEILIGNRNITEAHSESEKNDIRADLGVLFQSSALFDSLTVYDNIVFPLIERGKCTRNLVHGRVMNMLEALSLERYAFRFTQELSIGIRKRVGLARALITEPSFLLIDEPNTGLDPLDGQEVYDLIKLSKNRFGFTGVVISHELPEVFQVSDTVVMLLQGKVVHEGTPVEMMASQNAAVQQFLHGKIDGPIKIQ